jgi:hypothetical protein
VRKPAQRLFVLAFLLFAPASAWSQFRFPSLAEQKASSPEAIQRGSELEKLIEANQDFSMLDPSEAKDLRIPPPWLRVWWRKEHPELTYDMSDPTGGYPLVLKEIWEWMLHHQDLRPGEMEPDRAPGEAAAGIEASVTGELRISGAQTTPRSESDIRINYWDAQKIISASNSIVGSGSQSQFFSLDGGVTWGQTSLPKILGDGSHSDPTVDWTSDGNAWSTTLGITGGTLRLRSYISTDNGQTWAAEGDPTPSDAQTSVDKQMVWVDHSATSAFPNRMYAIWHNGTPAFVSRRTAGVGGTWSAPLQVSGAESTGTAIGNDIKTNSFGDVFAFWPTTTNRRVFVRKSTDGGDTYPNPPVQIAQLFDGFDIGVPSFNNRRALIYVSAGAYRTALKNLVYASWTDLTGAAGCTAAANEPGANVASACKTRIWFSRSTDGGATWSLPSMINNQASLNDQYNQWMVVDETTGMVSIIYYDTVADAGRLLSHVYYQSSYDDGVSWNPPTQVTSQPTNETAGGQDSGNQYGDYNGLTGYAATLFPSWTDRRGGAREEIWTAKITDAPCTSPGAPTIGTATATAANQITVSWSNGAPPAASFRIERAIGTCAAPGAFAQIATGVAASPYLDNTVSGTVTYAYRVVGLDGTGVCGSAVSSCVEATATGACTLAPNFAGLATASNAGAATCGVDLSWAAAAPVCSGPVTYNVYRSTTANFTPSGGNQIATGLSGTSYSDTPGLNYGTTYYYEVHAVDSSNAAEETNTVEKNASPTGPVSVVNFVETFEGAQSGGGFDNTGWTHQAVSGAVDWVWSTAQSQTPTHSWFSDSESTVTQRVLRSPQFLIQPTTTLSFFHTFAFEGTIAQCFDAGTLESSPNGTTWTVVPDAAFTAGLFNGTVNGGFSNPLAGKRAWCAGTIGAMTQVTVNLGGTFSGQNLFFRWNEGDDSSAQVTGWFVDSVTFNNAGVAGACASPVDLLGVDVE